MIGETRMAYDYWGETMNIASRIEGAAHPDGIAVSETTWLRGRGDRHFDLPQTLTLKGVGEMSVYRLAVCWKRSSRAPENVDAVR